MTASPVDVAVNPNNTAQRYVLWGNGRIDNYGGAVPITGGPTWYDWIGSLPVAVALHITDWTTGAGYVLDLYGGFHPLNGASLVNVGELGAVQGVPYTAPARNYVDWAWNPNGSGQGYVLSQYGQLHGFGGATAPPRGGGRWGWPAAKKLQMRFSPDVRAITLDLHGGIHADFAAVLGDTTAYWPGNDFARDFVITDWDTGGGHVLDLFGGVHEIGPAADTHGWPYRPHADVARVLHVLSASDPQRFWQVWSGGQSYEYVSSSPPAVIAGGAVAVSPPATVTSTTRPVLAWSYSDPQADSQKAWQLLVLRQSDVDNLRTLDDGTAIDDPIIFGDDSDAKALAVVSESGVGPTTRGTPCPIDLPNGSWRLYVRAKDTAGQWSAWDDHAWTQDVPQPAAPTGLTAIPDQARFTVALSVSVTAGGSADLVRFEASDDGALTWAPVPGADAVPLVATTTAVDRVIPLGVERRYRAVAYATDPAVASPPSNIATAIVTERRHVLTAVDDPTLGGRIKVVGSVRWARPATAGVFQGLGDEYPTVVSDGRPKARRTTLQVRTEDAAAWSRIQALVEADSVLLHRDPFGEVMYCRVVGDWAREQIWAGANPGESTPLRHLHTTDLPLVEVRPPA